MKKAFKPTVHDHYSHGLHWHHDNGHSATTNGPANMMATVFSLLVHSVPAAAPATTSD
jgi:hypothetical protein